MISDAAFSALAESALAQHNPTALASANALDAPSSPATPQSAPPTADGHGPGYAANGGVASGGQITDSSISVEEQQGAVVAPAFEAPAAPEEYRLNVHGLSDKFGDPITFRTEAASACHELGVPQPLASHWVQQVVAGLNQGRTDETLTMARAAQESELRKAWGGEFDGNVKLVTDYLNRAEVKQPGTINALVRSGVGFSPGFYQHALQLAKLKAK